MRAVDADVPFAYDEQPGWATFPKPRAEHAYTAAVVRVSGSDADRTALDGVTTTFPKIQPLPDGEILLVGTRAERRPDGSHDLNASVLGLDGMRRREFLLGDGIEDVQTTADGRIWVSYFDEGVFGNFGWGEPGGPAPIGSSGLVRWLSDRRSTGPQSSARPRRDADCYALNVASDAVWACYYTEFPLVRIAGDDSIASWTTPWMERAPWRSGTGARPFMGAISMRGIAASSSSSTEPSLSSEHGLGSRSLPAYRSRRSSPSSAAARSCTCSTGRAGTDAMFGRRSACSPFQPSGVRSSALESGLSVAGLPQILPQSEETACKSGL